MQGEVSLLPMLIVAIISFLSCWQFKSQSGDRHIVKELLRNKANAMAVDYRGRNTLMWAASGSLMTPTPKRSAATLECDIT
jgi:hypothetical protein